MTLDEFNQARKDVERYLILWEEALKSQGLRVGVMQDAPSTYKDVVNSFLNTGILVVYEGASENTIFSHPRINHLFRAWHDLGHITNKLDFQFHNERKLGEIQANEVYDALLNTAGHDRANNARSLVRAEIIGQIEYYQIHRKYVDDQKSYTMGYLGVKEEK